MRTAEEVMAYFGISKSMAEDIMNEAAMPLVSKYNDTFRTAVDAEGREFQKRLNYVCMNVDHTVGNEKWVWLTDDIDGLIDTRKKEVA